MVVRFNADVFHLGKSPDDLQGKQNLGSLRNNSLKFNQRPIRDQNWAPSLGRNTSGYFKTEEKMI